MSKDGKPMVKEKEGLVSRIDHSRRYSRNMTTISRQEQELLKEKSVCVVGCGGLGGGVIEALARMGVGHMTLVDGDCFDVTNLNRQVFSNEKNIGCSKACEAARQIEEINSEIDIKARDVMLDGDNAASLVKDHDVVVDALDNISARRILEEACEEEGIPLVHGAIAGWTGQVAVITPGCRLMENLYGGFSPWGNRRREGDGKSIIYTCRGFGNTGGGNGEAAARQGRLAYRQTADDGSAGASV